MKKSKIVKICLVASLVFGIYGISKSDTVFGVTFDHNTGIVLNQDGDKILPDPILTPGKADPALTKEVICDAHWTTKNVRNVPEQEKEQVFQYYGIPKENRHTVDGKAKYEIDHLISLENGGSNDVANLWPQPYYGDWNAHQKDRLENLIHKKICSGEISLEEGQKDLSINWIEAYHKYILKDH